MLHEIVERDTTVAANPGAAVAETGRDVRADTLFGDPSWNFCVQEIGGGNFDVITADMIL